MKQNLQHWLSVLESLNPANIELGLDRCLTVYRKLGRFKPAPVVVTVGGTNGKGSTVKAIELLLQHYGKRVGVYTSPHIHHYNERVSINGKPVDDDLLVCAFEKVEQARSDTPLTYFEFGTLAALVCFEQCDLDVVILEVGLGGRMDAVNIIDADIAVITSIDFDHMDWLGDTRDAIAYEKAGIIRPYKPLVCGEVDPPSTLLTQVAAQQVEIYQIGNQFGVDSTGSGWVALNGQRVERQIPITSFPVSNVLCALQVIALMGAVPEQTDLNDICSNFQLPGRFECVHSSPSIYLDVGHNPHAARYLASRIKSLNRTGPVYALYSALSDKDAAGTISELRELVDRWYSAPLMATRAMSESMLESAFTESRVETFEIKPTVEQAYLSIVDLARKTQGLVLVFGSFYLISEVKELQGK